jgi:hypothetical protein
MVYKRRQPLGLKGRKEGGASLAIFNYTIDTAIILLLCFYPTAPPLYIPIYSACPPLLYKLCVIT